MVETIVAAGSGLDELAGPAGGLDPLAGRLGELVGVDRELLVELAAAEDLHGDVAPGCQAGALERGQVDGGAVVEAAGEVVQVHVLRVGPEPLERHRHLLVRAAQLAHPHVQRVLAALEVDALLGARAGAVALVAAARRLAVAGAMAAPDALAVLARAVGGLQVVEADVLGLDVTCARRRSRLAIGGHYFSSTVTR